MAGSCKRPRSPVPWIRRRERDTGLAASAPTVARSQPSGVRGPPAMRNTAGRCLPTVGVRMHVATTQHLRPPGNRMGRMILLCLVLIGWAHTALRPGSRPRSSRPSRPRGTTRVLVSLSTASQPAGEPKSAIRTIAFETAVGRTERSLGAGHLPHAAQVRARQGVRPRHRCPRARAPSP